MIISDSDHASRNSYKYQKEIKLFRNTFSHSFSRSTLSVSIFIGKNSSRLGLRHNDNKLKCYWESIWDNNTISYYSHIHCNIIL
jgi:hypothetical protein